MYDAVSYHRFSTAIQARGDSSRRQATLADEYCRRNGLRLIDTFLDAGLSAYTGANLGDQGALRTLLDAARLGRFKPQTRLIVESLDRLSRREISVAVRLFLDIIDTGLVIVTLIDGEQVFTKDRIDNDLTGLIIAIVILSRANNESRIKSERASQSQQARREKARQHGTPITAKCPSWLSVVGTGDARHFVVDKHRARTVERIFKLAASGLGQYRIAEYLNGHHVPTLSGHPDWNGSMVSYVLGNSAVIGRFQPHYGRKSEYGTTRVADPDGPIEGYFPAIISRELYGQARLAADARLTRRMKRRPRLYANLVRGLGSCAVCGGTLHYLESVWGFEYLRCSNSRYQLCSNRGGFRYEKLEPLLTALDELIEVAPDVEKYPINPSIQLRELALIGSREIFLHRFRLAKQKMDTVDAEQRRQARKALWGELRRLIDTVVLHPDRTLTVRTRPDIAGWKLSVTVHMDKAATARIIFPNGKARPLPIGLSNSSGPPDRHHRPALRVAFAASQPRS